jgi:hypothetical protein
MKFYFIGLNKKGVEMDNNLDKYQWYSVITKSDGTFDCLVDGKSFSTKKGCLQAIKVNKKQDKELGWEKDYLYSEPRQILTS